MVVLLCAALLLGIATGQRTFTGLAVYFLHKGGIAGIVFAVFALGEYVGDTLPQAPARTRPLAFMGRLIAGGIVGWLTAGFPGIVAGMIGAFIGAYGGLALRLRAIRLGGAIPAAIIEDVVSIGIAIAGVALASR